MIISIRHFPLLVPCFPVSPNRSPSNLVSFSLFSSSSSFSIFFHITYSVTRFTWCCLCVHRCGAFHWMRGNTPKEEHFSPLAASGSSVTVRPHELLLPIDADMFAVLILCRPCASTHKNTVFMSAIAT